MIENWTGWLLVVVAVPLLWKIAPWAWGKYQDQIDAGMEWVLTKAYPLWKGRGGKLKSGVDEVTREIKENIDDVEKKQSL